MAGEYVLLITLALIVLGLFIWNTFLRKTKRVYKFEGCFGHAPLLSDDIRNVRERHVHSKEELCRLIFEHYFRQSRLKFPRTRPSFLRNPKTGRNLELDGYNESVINARGHRGLAFEYNGSQHYHHQPKYHKSQKEFDDICERDELKKELCRKRGVNLIVIKYDVPRDKLRGYIERRLYELDYYAYK